MFKSTVTRLFMGSLITVAAGAVVLIVGIGAAISNGVLVMDGAEVVGLQSSPLGWFLIAIAALGGVAIVAGFIGGFVSWIGALLNTSQLQSKTWFLVLLLLGIFNFGFIAMVAYVIAGPDGRAPRLEVPATAAATA